MATNPQPTVSRLREYDIAILDTNRHVPYPLPLMPLYTAQSLARDSGSRTLRRGSGECPDDAGDNLGEIPQGRPAACYRR